MNKNRKPFNKLYRNVLSSAKSPEEKGLGNRTVGRTEARKVTITPEILEKIYNKQNGKCAMSGVFLNLDFLYKANAIMAPSVDRIDSEGDYTPDNVQIVMRGVNHLKGNSSNQEANEALKAIKYADFEYTDWIFPKPPYDEIFEKPIDKVIDDEILGEFNVFIAPMNAGKTYNAFKYLIPELIIRKEVDVFYYFAPMCENIEENQFNIYIDEVRAENPRYKDIKIKFIAFGGGSNKKWSDVQFFLNQGYKVVIGSTDSSLDNILKIDEISTQLIELGSKFALIRDEVHYGSISDKKYSEQLAGVYQPHLKARMFKLMLKFLETTPWIFGFTATPTKEMIRDDFGAIEYKIKNKWVSPKQMIGVSAWAGHINKSLSLSKFNDDSYMKNAMQKVIYRCWSRTAILRQMIDSALNGLSDLTSEQISVLKKVELMSSWVLKTDIGSEEKLIKQGKKIGKKAYLDRILTILSTIKLPGDFHYIVTTAGKWDVYDSVHKKTGDNGSGNEWLDLMNDPNHKARGLIVVNKGSQGINIPSLTDALIFRNPVTKDKTEDTWITKNAIQFLGRLVRQNWGGLTIEELNLLPRKFSYEILSQLNTFDIEIPASPQWNQTVNQFLHPVDGYAVEAMDVFGGWPYQRKVIV